MDHLEQKNRELRGEVTTLRAKVEKLTLSVSSLTVTKDHPQFQRGPQQQCQLLCIQQPRQWAPQQFNPHYPAYHPIAIVMPDTNVVQNPGYQPQFQLYQQ